MKMIFEDVPIVLTTGLLGLLEIPLEEISQLCVSQIQRVNMCSKL